MVCFRVALIGLLLSLGACAGYQGGPAWDGYTRSQIAAGGLRTDRDAADIPFDDTTLADNFITVALGIEPNPVGPDDTGRTLPPGILRRWGVPIRWTVANDSATAGRDTPRVERMFSRLQTITGHDIAEETPDERANLFVFFLRPEDYRSLAANPPDWPTGRWLARFVDRFGRAQVTPCVATFTATDARAPVGAHRIVFAVVLIRADLPGPLAQACIEEELAQTMGLPNDADHIRPSIFNDDQQFALLTRHDEALLRLLYDPRLEPGMRRDEIEAVIGPLARTALESAEK